MTKIEALTRRNLILGAIALLLIVFLVFRPSETSAVRTADLPLLFPGLESDQVHTITLEQSDKELRIERADKEGWKLASKADYPARADDVNAFLEALTAARRKKDVTVRADTFDKYAGPRGWTLVHVADATGTPLAQFRLGKSAGWPDSYVWIDEGGRPKVVRAYNLSSDRGSVEMSAWVEARLWPHLTLPDVERVDVFQRDEKKTLSFVRRPKETPEEAGETTTWVMVAPDEADAETFQVEGLIRSFTGMRLQDVVAQGDDPEIETRYGFEDPAYRVIVWTKPEAEGEKSASHTLEIGAPVEGEGEGASTGWTVRRGGDAWIFEVGEFSIGDFRRAPEEFLPKKEDEAAGSDAPEPAPDEATGDPDGDAPPPDEPTDEPED